MEADDAALVARAKANDLQAFDQLIQRYERRVISLCYRHFRSYEEACDLAQEIFLQVFQRLKDFEGRSAFGTWLTRIALNACYNRHRFLKAKGRSSQSSLEGMLEASEAGADSHAFLKGKDPGALKELEAREELAQLRQALEALDEASRKAVELVDIEGLDYSEASKILKVPVNTLRSRLSRARQALKTKILRMRKRLGEG
jgi:RNA polymerase sigma-70 factor (ECF subfamily)